VDRENRPMFNLGSGRLKDYSRDILEELGQLINRVPNRISITGHTDTRRFQLEDYTNWELSTDRANAARRALITGGMEEDKVARVVGLGSTVLFDRDDPQNPINRRISIIVMNRQTEEAVMDRTSMEYGGTQEAPM
ncbi:MAG: OmpA family protein, partial [Ectothiorhodospira sp.]